MKGRPLKAHERALWDKVKRTVEPLKPADLPPELSEPSPQEAPATAPEKAAMSAPQGEASKRPARPRPPPGDLDRKVRRKLARGVMRLDARLDLHGLTLEEAEGALSRFVQSSALSGRRTVLIITGKGRGGEGRGVLRKSVPVWLARRDLQRFVVSYGPAHAVHGGDGALYVRLRHPSPR